MRKALFIGINNYGNTISNLRCCINDATEMAAILKTNEDGSRNFDVKLYTDVPEKNTLMKYIHELFKGDEEIQLLYFAGHGVKNAIDSYLVTPDYQPYNPGISVTELLKVVSKSSSKNKVIILDCCHSGATGETSILSNDASLLVNGLTILTASKSDQLAMESGGHGTFTSLLLEGLKGAAADFRGRITPAAVYHYIDKALGAHEQRPVFKTNISEFIQLRKVIPRVTDDILRKLVEYFPTPDYQYGLNPSYEDTNSPEVKPLQYEPYAIKENVAIFKTLQLFNSIGLLEPVGAPFMFFAAMNSKSCKLTALGHQYWRLAHRNRF